MLRTSEALDALCFINVLRGDAFYTRHYPAQYERWAARLGGAERAALARLTERIVVQAHNLVPATLTLFFSASSAATVDDLLGIVTDDAAWQGLRQSYLATSYGKDDALPELEEVRGDLRTLLLFLQREGFSRYWQGEVLPELEATIGRFLPQLGGFDVVGADERVLGRSLVEGPPTAALELSAFVVKFVRPHGIRLIGWRFLTDASYPLHSTVTTALHELLHPPFERKGVLAERLSALEKDAFYQRLVREHDPAFGYRTAEGLTEEDCATAVHIFNAERMGVLRTRDGRPRTGAEYFRNHDDGMHVLAFILYQELKRADLSRFTTYEAFILHLFDRGKLVPGQLEQTFTAYPDHYPIKALQPRPTTEAGFEPAGGHGGSDLADGRCAPEGEGSPGGSDLADGRCAPEGKGYLSSPRRASRRCAPGPLSALATSRRREVRASTRLREDPFPSYAALPGASDSLREGVAVADIPRGPKR